MHFATIRDCYNYFTQHSDIYENSTTLSDVDVLYLPDTRLFKGSPYDKVFHLAVDAIAENGIVYKAVRLSDAKPAKGVMAVPDAEFLSGQEVKQLEQLKSAGTKFIFLGNPGVYKDNGEERENWPFKDDQLIPLPVISNPESTAEFQKQLINALPRSVQLNKPGYLMLERAITADGREVLHILNIDNDNPVHDLEIKINGAGVLSEIISPDDPAPKYSIENNVIRLETLDTLVTLIFKK
jgi:hypothetical protein